MDRARSALARAIKNVHPLCLCASNRAIRSMVKRLAQAPAPPTPLCQRHRSSIIALRETAHCASGLVPQSVLAQHRSVTCQAIVNPESKAALRQTRIPVAPNRRRALIFQHLRPALTVLPLRALISPILNSATTADSTVKDAWGRLTSHARMRPIATATTQTTQQVSAGDSGSSSGSESAAESGSATDTASTSPTTADTDSTTETFAATDTSYTATNDIGGTTSSTFSSSRTSSAGGISQTSATSGNANGNPINATSNGQPTVGEGIFGVLTVLTVCFTSFFGLVF
jgi:hypothetical protein